MISQCLDISSVANFEKENKYIIDPCVLLYVFYTSGSYNQDIVREYTSFYSNIVSNDCKVILSLNLLSEFFNRFIKLEYERYLRDNNLISKKFTFKQYKNCDDYNETISELRNIYLYQLSPYSEIVSHTSSDELVLYMLDEFVNRDLNDTLYCCTAKKMDIPIVTHDYDYKSSEDCIIITANRRILSHSNK